MKNKIFRKIGEKKFEEDFYRLSRYYFMRIIKIL